MKKIKIKVMDPPLSRQRLADPHIDIPYKEILIKSCAIDLTDNHIIIDLGNGYSKIEPIDKTKLIKE